MLGTQNLALFIVSGLMLNMTPGQDTLYIIGRSVGQGRRAGVLSVLGISTGCFVHTLAAAFGLTAILSTSASAYQAVKLVGAAYLCYLGIRLLIDRGNLTVTRPDSLEGQNSWSVYRAGVLTNVLNPKVAVFFMAFLPQFVDPSTNSETLSFLFLGLIFIFNGTLWCLLVAWFASSMNHHLRARAGLAGYAKRATGALFVALGVKLAVSK